MTAPAVALAAQASSIEGLVDYLALHVQLSFFVFLIGLFLLFIEAMGTGLILPGIVGTLCAAFAGYSLYSLEGSWLGLIIIAIGMIFLITEALIKTRYISGLFGAWLFLVGSWLLLFQNVPGQPAGAQAILLGLAFSFVIILFISALFFKTTKGHTLHTGTRALVGKTGPAMNSFDGHQGRIWIHGESWQARSSVPIKKGQRLKVTGYEGLILVVQPDDSTE